MKIKMALYPELAKLASSSAATAKKKNGGNYPIKILCL